jgi:tetratricopeptide (TPR) repeat protein
MSKRRPLSQEPCGSAPPRGAHRAPPFSIVRVVPGFCPRDYAATFAALQEPAMGGKLLDLVSARLLSADVFKDLARAWTVDAGVVPRLGILLSFERWVMHREAALADLEPLAMRGVRIEVLYAEQAAAGYLGPWFAHGQFVHNVPGAIATLAAHWYPSDSWSLVIDTLARLARSHTTIAELPLMVTRLAALALSCGDAVRGATLAREALYYLPETPSATRCQALRELGTALICQGQTTPGLALLDQAFVMSTQAKVPDIGASALAHSGLSALNHGDYAGAERRFRRVIDLLSTAGAQRNLLALAHHNLAVALRHQGHPDAARHAEAALAIRTDHDSHLADEDRILLTKLRERREDGAAADAAAYAAPLALRSSEPHV